MLHEENGNVRKFAESTFNTNSYNDIKKALHILQQQCDQAKDKLPSMIDMYLNVRGLEDYGDAEYEALDIIRETIKEKWPGFEIMTFVNFRDTMSAPNDPKVKTIKTNIEGKNYQNQYCCIRRDRRGKSNR